MQRKALGLFGLRICFCKMRIAKIPDFAEHSFLQTVGKPLMTGNQIRIVNGERPFRSRKIVLKINTD